MIAVNATLNCAGRLLDLTRPVIMGILNQTPDSFYAGSRSQTVNEALRHAEAMLNAGATILDVGGASSRPGSAVVAEPEECQRVVPVIEAIRAELPEAIVSIDTWRAGVARAAVDAGASIVNDISAGRLDPDLVTTVARLKVPYILMHMQGTPQTMQQEPVYEDVVREVLDFFIEETGKLYAAGISDIVLDPGFGFGKTVAHNYLLLKHLRIFSTVLGLPVMVGISRKSMICNVLQVKPDQALNGSAALHMVALQNDARLLRVHDAREAWEVIRLWEQLQG